MPEIPGFYIIIARKIFFPIFGGEGTCPPPLSPVSYAYAPTRLISIIASRCQRCAGHNVMLRRAGEAASSSEAGAAANDRQATDVSELLQRGRRGEKGRSHHDPVSPGCA